VDISNGIDAVLNWNPVTHNIYSTPLTPDGYLILYNETPYEDDHYYYFLGRSYTTSYTHHDVAEFRDQMYYRIKAYKNYRADDEALLDDLIRLSKTKSLLWKDALDLLEMGGN